MNVAKDDSARDGEDKGGDKIEQTSIKHENTSDEPKNIDDKEGKDDITKDLKKSNVSNAFMQLTYTQKDICVGSFWETFCQEAENQGVSAASFATFLGARAAIPGPSAPQGAWGQFSSGNRSVLDTFRKLRYGKCTLFEHTEGTFLLTYIISI